MFATLIHRSSQPALFVCALVLLGVTASTAQSLPPNPLTKNDPKGPYVATTDGRRVYDAKHDVTWLADGNLAATNTFGVQGINPSGSMSYETARRYVAAMNQAAYLGRTDWTLPITFGQDKSCDRKNRHYFGWKCSQSPLVSMFRTAFDLPDYATAVPIPPNEVKGFRNFQPYIYWAGAHNVGHDDNENGMVTFSFNNGFQGANVSRNRMYTLPMVVGPLTVDPTRARKLKAPYVVYDAVRDVTWLADANYAKVDNFGVPDIAPTGAMRHATAEKWVAAMNAEGFLGTDRWQLPRSPEEDDTCSAKGKLEDCAAGEKCRVGKFGYGCQGSDLGALYHLYLGLARGTPVVKAPDTVKPTFLRNVEPYLYWSCHAEGPTKRYCAADKSLPADNFGWSFSFGNGFQGTTLGMNELYVWPYHPGHP